MSESEEVVSEPVEAEHVREAIPEEIPTVVVGKKKKIYAEPQTLPEQLEAPPIEVEKPKPKRASRARVSTKALPPPEPVPEPVTPAPKKAGRMK